MEKNNTKKNTSNKSNNTKKGALGEKFASEYLTKLNYKILITNFRVGKLGEIDIIAQDEDCICFIEVKTRTSLKFGTPAESISKKKQENIKFLANIYTDRNNLYDQALRFDVVEVILSKSQFTSNTISNNNFILKSINLIRNAF